MKKIVLFFYLTMPFIAYEQTSSQSPSYVITFQTPNYIATPVAGSGLAGITNSDFYTVLNTAFYNLKTVIVPGDTARGWIHLAFTGVAQLSNELDWSGADGSGAAYNQIKLTGMGWSTRINQNTTGKHAFHFFDGLSIVLEDMTIGAGSSAFSAIYCDSSGTHTKISVRNSLFNNLYIVNSSSSYPAIFLQNYFYIRIPYMRVWSNNYTAWINENAYTSVSYGNSHFGLLEVACNNPNSPNSAFMIRSINNKRLIDHVTVDNLNIINGYYGLNISDAEAWVFNKLDIETPVQIPIIMGSSTSQNTSYQWAKANSFNNATLLSNTAQPLITAGAKSYGNVFKNALMFPINGTTPIVADSSINNMPNSYDMNIEFPGNPNPYFARPSSTNFSWRSYLGTTNYLVQNSGSFTPTLTNTTNIMLSTLSKATYSQSGNNVHVMVSGNLTPITANTSTVLTLNLPIATTNGSQNYVGQITFANSGGPTFVSGIGTISSTSGIAFQFQPTTNAAGNFNISFDYTTN